MKPKDKRPIAVILGTRPEIIKLSPVIRLLQKKKRPFVLIHTGQHYSYSMDEQFFKELTLGAPDHRFERPSSIGPNMHEQLVDWMTESVRRVLDSNRPSAVLVQGDTDTVLAGARAASTLGDTTICHVEAGLRSYDNAMPEERNRVEADKLSHILFAPTETARQNLIKEKLVGKRIEVTGNTIVDALFENLEIAKTKAAGGLVQKGYALVTLHRPESVDNRERFLGIVNALQVLSEKKSLRMVVPLHPRTEKRLNEYGLTVDDLRKKGFVMPGPIGFLDFIWQEKNAELVLTDSGGVQEEACILKVPCVTIRTTTERPETVAVGANVVAGYESDEIVSNALGMLEKPRNWPNPFGDGKASERILEILEREEVHA